MRSADEIFKNFFGGKDPFASFFDDDDDFFGGSGFGNMGGFGMMGGMGGNRGGGGGSIRKHNNMFDGSMGMGFDDDDFFGGGFGNMGMQMNMM